MSAILFEFYLEVTGVTLLPLWVKFNSLFILGLALRHLQTRAHGNPLFNKRVQLFYCTKTVADLAFDVTRVNLYMEGSSKMYDSQSEGRRTRACSIPEVKTCRTRIVLGWLTVWKYLELKTAFCCFYYMIELI